MAKNGVSEPLFSLSPQAALAASCQWHPLMKRYQYPILLGIADGYTISAAGVGPARLASVSWA